MMHKFFRAVRAAFALIAMAAMPCPALSAELIKIGITNSLGVSPLFIAQEEGYFAAEGAQAELVYFEASQPIAVAVASGAIHFGLTGFTAAFYSLAEQGVLKIIAGSVHEAPGTTSLISYRTKLTQQG